MSTKNAAKSKTVTPLSTKQQEIFVKYFPVVRKVVNSMRNKLPSYADIDELHSAGVAGLADAVKRLDPSREDTFDGYIATRIRGAIIDELRSLDYMSRSARNDAKQIDKLREKLEQKLSRTPHSDEMRKAMGVSEKQYNKIMRRTQSLSFISLNDRPNNDDATSPSFVESVADDRSTYLSNSRTSSAQFTPKTFKLKIKKQFEKIGLFLFQTYFAGLKITLHLKIA